MSPVLIIRFSALKHPVPVPAVFGFIFELMGLVLFILSPVLESFVLVYAMRIAIELPVCVCLVLYRPFSWSPVPLL